MKKQTSPLTTHQERKLANNKDKRKEAKKITRIKRAQKEDIVYQFHQTILHFFSEFIYLV
jgi:hypothetical protein